MNEADAQYLEAFPSWIKSLKADALECADLIESDDVSENTKRKVTTALNYLFKSLDLIPDGIEDLGYIDDAFVLRVAASLACEELGAGAPEAVQRLAAEAELIRQFLGADFGRLEAFVAGLATVSVRGRSVDAVVAETEVRSELLADLRAWAESYEAPTFSRDERNLVKLRAFLGAKLPQN